MGSYQNSIMLGLKLESKDSIEGKLKTLIGTLNATKIDLDINIKNSDVAKQLETLTNLANNFKANLGGNISLGNVNEIINQATTSMERLNTEVLKTKTVLNQNGTGSRYSDIANGIGVVTKQTEILNQETKKWEVTEKGKTTTIINNEKIKKTLDDIVQAQEKLNVLESRGNININQIDVLKNNLSGAYDNIKGNNSIYNSRDITSYLNQVKKLENEENNLLKIQTEGKFLYEQYEKEKTQTTQQEYAKRQQLESKVDDTWQKLLYEQEQKNASDSEKLANQIQDAWDKTYKDRVTSEQNAIQQIEANEKKAYDNEILRLGEQSIAQQKAEQDLINQMANGREKSEIKTQQIDRSQELAQSKAINQSIEEEYKLEQEKEQVLVKQEEAYRQIDVLKSNGIISNNDISNLEKMTQEADSLQKINGVIKSIMSTSMMKESPMVSLSKQIEDAQIKLDKMKSTFGNKLPNGFTDSIQSSLNKIKEDLKTTDELGFNGLRTNLNKINTDMKVTTNETQQLVNSLKETNNGGFFSGISGFLGKVGIFYGVQQVVQEISQQFKNASDYVLTLDKNISNIEIVTGKSKDEVVQLTNKFKELGAQLHTTNVEMMSGSEELLRAGYSSEDTKKMMEQSVIGAKISGQTTQQVSEQLIAIKNAFNMSADSMSHVIDTFSKMDNTSSTSFKELADAIQRTSYNAQMAKVPLDTLTSYITTVSEKTRREASTINIPVA